jgi:hypothetical protein
VHRAFIHPPVTLQSGVGTLVLGVVDPHHAGVAEAVSGLLNRSIGDARESVGGHLPDWLVEDIRRNYISPDKVKTLWAPTGHRFAVFLDDVIVGTIHIGRDHEVILTVDRHRNNVVARDFPGFKPLRHHHVVNISVKHELRRAGVGTAMVEGIVTHFRHLFEGDGLWVRADPPWHPGLIGLGFVHDPSMDLFLDDSVARTAGLPHPEFNRRHACDCVHPAPADPEALGRRAAFMAQKKLQYLSMTLAFDRSPRTTKETPTRTSTLELATAAREVVAVDWGGVAQKMPRAVSMPDTVGQVIDVVDEVGRAGGTLRVRGRGHSADGQSLGDDVVLQTGGLRGIFVGDSEVTVAGGVPWQAVVDAVAPLGLYPPVLTGWLPASVGGTLSVGGYSKGSHRYGLQVDHVSSLVVVTGDGRRVACSATQAGWLHEAVLGGFGRFGVIVEATVPLVRRAPFVHVRRTDLGPDPAVLRDALMAAAASRSTFHVTSFWSGAGWSMVVADERDEDGGGGVPMARYVAPPRPILPPGPARWFHAWVPASALAPLLERAVQMLADDGGGLQVIPVRVMRGSRSSLLQMPAVPAGDLVFGVSITRDVRHRDVVGLEAEGQALLAFAVDHGATRSLTGTPPATEAEWRTHLGDHIDDVVRAARLTDPRGVFGSFTR